MNKRGHFGDSFPFENDNDIKGKDKFNDWTETFCEYNIDYQLYGSVCHLSEISEECLDTFSAIVFDCLDDDKQTCVPHASC